MEIRRAINARARTNIGHAVKDDGALWCRRTIKIRMTPTIPFEPSVDCLNCTWAMSEAQKRED